MNIMEPVGELIDYNRFQTFAEKRNNVTVQLIRDVAIEHDWVDLLAELARPTADIQEQTHHIDYCLSALKRYEPGIEQEIQTKKAAWEAHERSYFGSDSRIEIQKIFGGEAYFINSFLESDTEYSQYDPVATVTDINEYRVQKSSAQSDPLASEA